MKMIRERKEVKKMVEKKAKKVKMTKIRLLSNVVLVERKIGLILIFVGSVELVWREEKRRVVVFLVLGLGLIQSCTLIMGLDLMIVTILIWTSRGTNGPIGDQEPDQWQKGNHSQGMNWKSMIFISWECFSILTLFSKARIITMIPLSLVFVITWPLKLCVGWKQSSNLTVSPQPIFEFIWIKLLLIGQKVPFKSHCGFELKAWTQSTGTERKVERSVWEWVLRCFLKKKKICYSFHFMIIKWRNHILFGSINKTGSFFPFHNIIIFNFNTQPFLSNQTIQSSKE